MLLHPTSLPGMGGAGVLGDDACRFAGWLGDAGFGLWQMLPVGPVGASGSPYQSSSAFAGNTDFIAPGPLLAEGWLADAPGDQQALLDQAFQGFQRLNQPVLRAELQAYWQAQRAWLLPFGLFQAARARYGDGGWWTWPEALRDREPAAVSQLLRDEGGRVRAAAFGQWLFDRQWQALRAGCSSFGVELIGDLPIYVDLDSADVWWHRKLFRVDRAGRPEVVAGVPPDYFSADGQLWGNPLYAWEAHQADGFRWWRDRVRTQLRRFDYLRIDHFRGLEAYWEVPAGSETARTGAWRPAPGAELLAALGQDCGGQPFLAEDLGTITEEVHALRRQFGLPGMLIAQFAFDGTPDNPYLPANQAEEAVVYTGTHDNDTILGWYRSLDERTRAYVHEVLACRPGDMPDALVRSVWRSPAHVAIFPLQDLLGLGSEARMNTPATVAGNWRWRFAWEQFPAGLAAECRRRALAAGRIAAGPGRAQPVAAPVARRL